MLTHILSSIAVTEKGWTDGNMGLWWLKDFDCQTREKSDGRPRLLILDGHNSHYTLAFLEYANENNITVICYPSHTTHVLQGLDIVAFSVLKRSWTFARDSWEQDNAPVKLTKGPFLKVFSECFTKTMTPLLVHACFESTGIIPFNHDVVQSSQMGASIPHSTHADISNLASPVKRIILAQRDLLRGQQMDREDTPSPSQLHPSQDPKTFGGELLTFREDSPAARRPPRLAPASILHNAFQGSSMETLTSSTPITSQLQMPTPVFASPTRRSSTNWSILYDTVPQNRRKVELEEENRVLREVLGKSKAEMLECDNKIDSLNGQLALSMMTVSKARLQLLAVEKKKAEPKRQQINTGLGHVLTHTSFREVLAEDSRRRDDAEEQRVRKEELLKVWKEFHAHEIEAVEMWKAQKKVLKVSGQSVPPKPRLTLKRDWLKAVVGPSTFDGENNSEDDGSDGD